MHTIVLSASMPVLCLDQPGLGSTCRICVCLAIPMPAITASVMGPIELLER